MKSLLSIIDALANRSGLLPEFPGRAWVLLLTAASIFLGLMAALFYWVSSLRISSPSEKLQKGDDLARKGDLEGAKKVFLQLNAYTKAALIAQKLGQLDEALDLATRGKEFVMVGQLLAAAGRHEEAATAYEQARKPSEAAEEWSKAGQLDKALENYKAAGMQRKVIDLLQKMQRHSEFAHALSEELAKDRQMAGANPSLKQLERIKEMSTRAGDAFVKAGEFNLAYDLFLRSSNTARAAFCLEKMGQTARASDLYRQSGSLKDAARVLIDAGEYERAIDLYDEMEQLDDVPRILRLAGKIDQAKAVEARIALNHGDHVKGAELFAEAKEYLRAAELFDEQGNYPKAAECWEKASAFAEAAGAYERAGDLLKAAPLYSESGRHAESAICYEKSGEHEAAWKEYAAAEKFYDAGRLAESANQIDTAIEYYQKVPANSEYAWETGHAMARLFLKKGLNKLAGERFDQLCKSSKVTKARIEVFYDYAVFLEGTGKLVEASEWYEKLLAIDFHFRDVLARKKAIEERLRNESASHSETISRAQPLESHGFRLVEGTTLVERYLLKKRIGAGGTGMVFQATDNKLGRDVAIKFLSHTLLSDSKKEEMFLHEARVTANLSHPNIVSFYDGGTFEGQSFLIMEFVDGQDLKKIVESLGTLPIEVAIQLMLQMTSAVEYAHSRQIIHRDLKSPNVLVSKDWTVKIADFGLARVIQKADLTLTQSVGSPLYMAPELIEGGKYDHRVDLYALGTIFYEMLTGFPPFTEGEVAYHHLHTPVPLPSSKRKEVSAGIDAVVLKMLEKKPSQRYANATELRTDLATLS